MDLTFPTPTDMFNVRVAVVIIHRARLLLQGDHHYPFLVPPGGRCKLHEPTADAARREFTEELGHPIHDERLLWLVENFFDLDGRRVHELTFLYEAQLPPDCPLFERQGDFAGAEGNPRLFFRWVPLSDLSATEVYPEVLRTRAGDLPTHTERIVVSS